MGIIVNRTLVQYQAKMLKSEKIWNTRNKRGRINSLNSSFSCSVLSVIKIEEQIKKNKREKKKKKKKKEDEHSSTKQQCKSIIIKRTKSTFCGFGRLTCLFCGFAFISNDRMKQYCGKECLIKGERNLKKWSFHE